MDMEWKDVRSLLSKTQNILQGTLFLRNTIAHTLSEVLGVAVPGHEIKIKNKVVTLRSHPALKNEVVLKKTQILTLLQARGVGNQIVDIR